MKLIDTPMSTSCFLDVSQTSLIYQKKDDFFYNVFDWLCKNKGVVKEKDFEARIGAFTRNGNETNESVSYVLYDGNIVAGMMETRTAFNHLYFTFFRDLSVFGISEGVKYKDDFLLNEKKRLEDILSSKNKFEICENEVVYYGNGSNEDRVSYLRHNEREVLAGMIEMNNNKGKEYLVFRNIDVLEDIRKDNFRD